MKRCKLCKQVKPDTEFGCKPNNPGQLNARCKDCMNEFYRKRYQKRRLSGWKPKPHTPAQKDRIANRIKKFLHNNPERLTAKTAVRDATKNGERIIKDEYSSEHITGEVLLKPPYCCMCGKLTPSKSLHGHHYLGYKHPTSVIFICSQCHGAITALEREATRNRLPPITAVGNYIRNQRESLNFLPPSSQNKSLQVYNPSTVIQKQETNYDS
jgi:hypothetical protein